MVEQAAVLVDLALANDLQCWNVAKRAAALAANAKALANKKDMAVRMQELNAAASAVLALAEDMWRQEEAAAQQHGVDADCLTVPIEPPDHVDGAIWRIRAECALRAAPLDAILAKILRDDITHDAPVLLVTNVKCYLIKLPNI